MIKRKNVLIHIILIFCVFLTLGPFIWMILTSFKTYEESIKIPPDIFPKLWQFENYASVYDKFPFNYFYLNTAITVFATVIGQLFISSLAAYAFARLEFPGRDILFVFCLSLLMIPGQIFLIPHYEIMVKLKLANTVTALWLPKIFSVFGVFLLRQFFMSLPKNLDEAAKIDGCNYFQIYYKILLPLLKPALVSLAILTALATWKDLMWPLIVNIDLDKMTLSSGLALLIGQHTTIYPLVMAGGVMAVWPMILLFFIFQKQFIEGIASTGAKE